MKTTTTKPVSSYIPLGGGKFKTVLPNGTKQEIMITPKLNKPLDDY